MIRPIDLTPEEAAARLREHPATRVLDVREPAERAVASIAGSLHATPPVVREILTTWPRDIPILVYCHHGRRSRLFCYRLIVEEFKEVYNLAGGIEEWSRRVDSGVPRYGVSWERGIVRL